MDEQIVISRGNIGELKRIVNLNREIFRGMYADEPYGLEKYKKRLASRESVIFIAEKDGEMIGDSISYRDNNILYLWILGVDKNYRSREIGKSLIEKNEQFAKENNFTNIVAKVYNVSMPMHDLLKKRGYTIIETIKSEINSKYDVSIFKLKI